MTLDHDASLHPPLRQIVHGLHIDPEFGASAEKARETQAVSGVIDRSPLTMAPTRVAGTRNASANALTDIPSGLRNSSLNISPGWAVTRGCFADFAMLLSLLSARFTAAL